MSYGYIVEMSFGSLSRAGEEVCGDRVELAENSEGTFLAVADGRGSGIKANILASLTSKAIITMLSQGAEVSDVTETMASMPRVSGDQNEAFSTFTFLHIKPDGRGRMVEFDNPDAIVLRNGKALPLTRNIFSIEQMTMRETYINFKPGDCCILMSDGVIRAGEGGLLDNGWRHENVMSFLEKSYSPNLTARSIKSHLLNACNNLYVNNPGDDATVAVCKIKAKNKACIMVGAPANTDDGRRIFDLMGQGDTKIVCGDIAGQIVSRLAKKKLRKEPGFMTQGIPPIGFIDGIDLVTEGTVTLSLALEIMLQYEKDAVLNIGNNGPSLLAQALIVKCTSAAFFVGQTLDTDTREEPGVGIKLVNEIADCLIRLNKHVDIEYF